MTFNLKTSSLIKEAMASTATTHRRGGAQAGNIKYRLTSVEQSGQPQMYSNMQSINEHYSGDGGSVYFVFSGENAYDRPTEVGDDLTLNRMKMELAMREAYVNSVYLIPIEEGVDPNKETEKEWTKRLRLDTSHLVNLIQNHEDPEVRKQFVHIPFRNPTENDSGSRVKSITDEIKMHYLYFTKNAGNHEAYGGLGEIDLLKDSIQKTEKHKDEIYDVNSYIEEKIKGNADLTQAYNIIKELKIGLQSPSWAEIFLHMKKGKRLNFGRTREEISQISNLDDIAMYDSETGRKFGSNYPSTPQSAIFKIVGPKAYKNDPSEEHFKYEIIRLLSYRTKGSLSGLVNQYANTDSGTLYALLTPREKEVHRAKMNIGESSSASSLESAAYKLARMQLKADSVQNPSEELYEQINQLTERVQLLQYIRDNMNQYPPNHEKSFLRMYDELCNLYLEYNRERYGNGIFLQYSVVGENGPAISFRKMTGGHRGASEGNKRPFLPSTKAGDMREVIISVRYSKSTPVPQLARTNLQLVSSRMFNYENIKQELQKHGIGEVVIDQSGNPQEVKVQDMDEFFSRVLNNPNRVLVYRIDTDSNNNEEEQEGKFANLVWYTGLRSFGSRYDSSSVRKVYEDDGVSTKTIEGYGTPRISQGKYRSGNENSDLEDFSGDLESLHDAYPYAKANYGLDYPEEHIFSRMAKHIKPISKEFISIMNNDPEKRSQFDDLISEIENNINSGFTIITPYTKDIIDKAIKNVNVEIVEEDETVQEEVFEQPEENVPATPAVQTQTETEIGQANEFYQGIFVDKKRAFFNEFTKDQFSAKGYQFEESPERPGRYVLTGMPSWFVPPVLAKSVSKKTASSSKLSNLLKLAEKFSSNGQKDAQRLFEEKILNIIDDEKRTK
jgi:hypothetical protein